MGKKLNEFKIIVDSFGGDFSPNAAISGSYKAYEEFGIKICLCGDEKKIKIEMEKMGIPFNIFEIIHSSCTINNNDTPTDILDSKKECSMSKGLISLSKNKGDGFISAGNSGALLVGATMIVKRLQKIKRISFATLLPRDNGVFLLADCGANSECTTQILYGFAKCAIDYMKSFFGIENPKVGLLNIGEEENKGDTLRKSTYSIFKNDDSINFVGNIEPDKLLKSDIDILITDGFTGNILLKLFEGFSGFFIKKILNLIDKDKIEVLKNQFDYKNHGGAQLLGCSKPVFKAHGKSNDEAFKNGICNLCKFINKSNDYKI